MADPSRSSPLAHLGLAARIGEADAPVQLGWSQPAGMAIVRGRADRLDLPTVPNTVAGDNPRALWLGPDEWLLVGDIDVAALERDGLMAIDAGHARTVLTVAGAAADVLAKGCSLDFHLDAFPVETCAQSRLARISVLLHRRGAQRFDLYVGRSFAVYAWHWLADAAAANGYAVAGLDQ